jgi:hypothetical protein
MSSKATKTEGHLRQDKGSACLRVSQHVPKQILTS